MRFYTSSGLERPVLLCEETRSFAYDSLNGRYGKEVVGTPCVILDCLSDFENLFIKFPLPSTESICGIP